VDGNVHQLAHRPGRAAASVKIRSAAKKPFVRTAVAVRRRRRLRARRRIKAEVVASIYSNLCNQRPDRNRGEKARLISAASTPRTKQKKLNLKENYMLWTIFVILLVLWLLGFIGGFGGGLIHILIVIAVVILIINLLQGRGRGI